MTEEYCVPRSSFTDSHRTQALDVDPGRYSVAAIGFCVHGRPPTA